MADKTKITGYSNASNKVVGSSLTHTEYNSMNDYLLTEKEIKSAFEMDQDLKTTNTPTHLSIILTNSKGVEGHIFCKMNGVTGEMTFETQEEHRISMGLPKIIAGIADVIVSETNTISLANPMPNVNYVFSGMARASNGDTSICKSNPADNTVNSFVCDSAVSGKLYYTLTEILV